MPLNNYPTSDIATIADHQRLLAEEAAVLCLWFEWSIPATLGKGCVHYWHERWHLYCKAPVVPLFFLNGDLLPELFGWIREELKDLNGNGSVFLLRSGRVIESVRCVIGEGLNAISALCDRVFLKH